MPFTNYINSFTIHLTRPAGEGRIMTGCMWARNSCYVMVVGELQKATLAPLFRKRLVCPTDSSPVLIDLPCSKVTPRSGKKTPTLPPPAAPVLPSVANQCVFWWWGGAEGNICINILVCIKGTRSRSQSGRVIL